MKKTILALYPLFLFTSIYSNLNSDQISLFINASSHHNPENLPSSWHLFFEQKPDNLMWSILIPTLVERSLQFETLFTKLIHQIEDANLQDQIEIVFFRDDREADVGFKRNKLIENASGKYTCFVDDDDDVHTRYIPMLYEKLLEGKDCVKLVGIIDWIGQKNLSQRTFIHSTKYHSWFEKDAVYYRPPNHINPILRSITSQFKFIDNKLCNFFN